MIFLLEFCSTFGAQDATMQNGATSPPLATAGAIAATTAAPAIATPVLAAAGVKQSPLSAAAVTQPPIVPEAVKQTPLVPVAVQQPLLEAAAVKEAGFTPPSPRPTSTTTENDDTTTAPENDDTTTIPENEIDDPTTTPENDDHTTLPENDDPTPTTTPDNDDSTTTPENDDPSTTPEDDITVGHGDPLLSTESVTTVDGEDPVDGEIPEQPLSCTYPDHYCNPTALDLIRKVEDVVVETAGECQALCKRLSEFVLHFILN